VPRQSPWSSYEGMVSFRSAFFLITFVTPVLHFISVTVVRVILADKKDFNNFESYLEGSLCYDLEKCGKYRQLSLSPPKISL